jgi:hypothetical protein
MFPVKVYVALSAVTMLAVPLIEPSAFIVINSAPLTNPTFQTLNTVNRRRNAKTRTKQTRLTAKSHPTDVMIMKNI